MASDTLTVALISDVFVRPDETPRLVESLKRARSGGAELVVLPELPLNSWCPATEMPDERDAEAPGGPRHQALSDAARAAGLGVVGGAIVQDPQSRRRHNTALVFDGTGRLVASYRKVHLPDEKGFWETRHYDPGDDLPSVIPTFGIRIGLQLCSDVNRPEGSRLLAALGAEIIVSPRATETATFPRWKTVLIANALTSCAYVLSVARPHPEFGVPLGGASLAVAPTGELLVETTESIALVKLYRGAVEESRRQYPGYLATRADLYAEGWSRVRATRLPHENSSSVVSDSPIVCTLPPEVLQARKSGLLPRVAGLSKHTVKIANGYRFQFAPDGGTLSQIVEIIDAERQCCQFLRFDLSVEPESGPISLQVTGPPGTQQFLDSMLAGHDL